MNRTQTIGVTVACLLLAMGSLGGCALRHSGGIVPISNVAEGASFQGLAVDVDNRQGDVDVIVDTAIDHPIVRAVARGQKASDDAHWTAASLQDDSGHQVLRVLSTAHPEDPTPPPVDITVRVPDCAGVRVRTRDGQVVLSGVRGAIDVQGGLTASGPAITIHTKATLTDPILLHADRGDIELRMGAASAGRVQAVTPHGLVHADAFLANTENVQATRKDWTAVLNGGTNEIKLLADEGNITFRLGR